MSLKIVRLSSLLFAFALAASAFCFDSSTLAGNIPGQNANSSTTVTMENSNAAKPSRGRGRRGRRPAAASPAESPAMPASATQETTAAATEQTDLSGTYTGTFDCPDAGVSGETTLTITGNQFTLTDGKSGRIVASTTSGYTAVAMQFGELTAGTVAQPGSAPMIISMRAKKSRDRLTLATVPGATHVCSFMHAGTRARQRRARAATPASPATPATPATPAEPMVTPATPATPAEPATPSDAAGPMPPATPTPRRRGRRGTRGNTNTNSNRNDNTGEGNANARPTPPPGVPKR